MVFKFVLLSDEVDDFIREIHIDSEATFLELHDAILKSVGFANDQMSSFLICNEYWERETEITLVEMDTSSEVDSLVMKDVKLEEFVSEEGQKLMFVFDYMNERSFFMELKDILPGKDLPAAVCKVSKGVPPAQILDNLFLDDLTTSKATPDLDDIDDFQSGDDFDEEELDNLSINDNYFEEQQ